MKTRTIKINDEVMSASVIAFDKDGTLFQAEPFWLALNEERKKRFIKIAGPEHSGTWDQMMGVEGDTVDHHGLLAIAGEQEEKIAITALLYQLTKNPWVTSLALATKLLEESNAALDIKKAFHPMPGAVELLEALKEAGYVIGIVTSDQHDRTVECLKLLGFQHKVDFIVTPADVKNGKPSPDMLQKVCRNFTIPPGELLMIGDSIVDSMMARSAGCKSVSVHEHEDMRKTLNDTSDYLIPSLSKIKVDWD
ncbi:HAD family hydrolase [Jeotgalibacillus sp. S-D1]|uniref:HAD family hydrolase n=1 Tax=Jeotgalibacillus sp. S-D1 TaxID=2552189 RepID=UPI00105A0297|nr:HAD-IA family hydrolase [Jeotgalibacillus sp. S-D1]TDL32500.1 HAD family hydrolase [Jeotgalibacillus sp. S-D1]